MVKAVRKLTDAQILAAVRAWKTSDLVAAVAARMHAQATPAGRGVFFLKWPELGQLTIGDFFVLTAAAAAELDRRMPIKDDYDV